MTAKQLEDIHNFKQEGDESLYQVWERADPRDETGEALTALRPWLIILKNGTTEQQAGISEAVVARIDWLLWLDAKFMKDLTSTRIVPSTRKLNKLKMSDMKNLDEQCLLMGIIEESFFVGTHMGYYTKDYKPSTLYGEKMASLEELLAKHQEESTRRIIADHGTSGLNKLHGVSFISGPESYTPEVLQHQLPPKELNPGNFTLPCMISKFNFYAIADLGASINVMPRSILKRSRDDCEKKSASTSKDAFQSQHKSSRKSAQAEEPSHTVEDSSMQQDQEFVTGDNDEQSADKEVTKADWFKKPERPPTPDPDWSKRRQVDFRPPQTWISQVAHVEEPPTLFDELMITSF
ncbi:hypothetical protein Tco_0856835 [Tanacetum coccineum]|uniref:Uncharacterized protein n=1 Tax=Tanacetum coccineum TaxID=301880 RepID=A0ABQ5B7J4_9ASTR